MSRIKPNDEGFSYLPGDVSTPDEGYRELANCIVAQAADDYVSFLLKPDYEDEVDAIKQPGLESAALVKVVRKFEKHGKDPECLEAVKKFALELMERTKANYKKRAEKLTEIYDQTAAAKDYGELKSACLRYKKYWKDLMWFAKDKSLRRKVMGDECLRFFHSDTFLLYTKDTIDPDRLIEECHKEAARIRQNRGVGEDEYVDRFTQ